MAKYVGRDTLEVLEGADNYNKWIADSIRKYVKSPALEIGAGTGNISSYFTDISELTLTDADPNLVRILEKKFLTKKNIRTESLDISSNFLSNKNHYKSVYSVNVLEHIKDDHKALQNMYSLLERHGKAVLLVPAKKYAYNKLDKNLGHFRRYEKKELSQKMEEANFKVTHLEYFNALGLLSWMVREKVSRSNTQLKHYQVKLFDLIVPILEIIEPKKMLPLGISLIAVGEKK